MQITQTNRGAWQISAPVTNGQDIWIEIRTYHDINEKQALASFYNTIWSMGWTPAE